MKKWLIYSITFTFLFMLFACSNHAKKDQLKIEKAVIKDEKPIEQAFNEMVKALHAPYNSGDKFFKIFTGPDIVNQEKNGQSGSHKITVPAPAVVEGNCIADITYEYLQYKPQDSDLIINGSITIFERSPDFGIGGNCCGAVGGAVGGALQACPNNIGFKQEVQTDTLKISGAFDAQLKFIIEENGGHIDISDETYDAMLLGDHSFPGFKVQFIYKGKTLETGGNVQNANLLEKLVKVS